MLYGSLGRGLLPSEDFLKVSGTFSLCRSARALSLLAFPPIHFHLSLLNAMDVYAHTFYAKYRSGMACRSHVI